MSNQPKLVLHEVGKSLFGPEGEKTILSGINLTVQAGEFLSIVGPSGCGKSTLLELLAGLTQPTEGEILLDGAPLSVETAHCGMVQQGYALFPWLTVAQNVEFGLSIRGASKEECHAASSKYLQMVFMQGYENHYPSELSGGMRQRVAIARALAYDPSFLLMDEPFAALDPATRATLQDELLNISSSTHKTIIFVTHDIFEAVALSDRVAVMSADLGRFSQIVRTDLPRPRKLADLKGLAEMEYLMKRIRDLIRRNNSNLIREEEEIENSAVI